MTPRTRHPGPVVLNGPRTRRRLTRREEAFGRAALETPLPGRLLVLLSRLHRSEQDPAACGEDPVV